MIRTTIAAAALAIGGGAAAQEVGPARVRYDGHRGVHVTARTPAEVATALSLSDHVWTCTGAGVGPFDVQMSPEHFAAFAATGIPYRVTVENVQAMIDAERAEIDAINANPGDNPGFYDTYHTRTEINTYLQQLAAGHATLAYTCSAGSSLEGREMLYIRITGPGDRTGRPTIVLNACQHAREWVAPPVAVYIAEQLLTRYATDPLVKRLVDSVEWVILPITNPDGYQYSWDTDRMWRKNRRPAPSGSSCAGVDTNRNFSFEWGLSNGSSGDPCDETYRGTAPASEPETKVIRDLIAGSAPVLATIDYHSFSQYLLEPWGYTPALPAAHATFQSISAAMAQAIQGVHGVQYIYGPGYTTIYPTSGTIGDWAYGAQGILAWGLELRPEAGSSFGFTLPSNQIVPTCEENFAGLMALAQNVAPPLLFQLVQGTPVLAEPGQATPIRVAVRAVLNTVQAGSVRLYYRIGTSGAPLWTPMTAMPNSEYQANLPGADCGQVIQYVVQATTNSGAVIKFPPASFGNPLEVTVADTALTFSDTCDTQTGWAVGGTGSTATAGLWVRNAPQATAAQPAGDHTPGAGGLCYVTDHRAGTSVGQYDVDGGTTILTSPTFNALYAPGITRTGSYVSYWRWYSSDRGPQPGVDPLLVQISANGSTWVTLEQVTDSAGVWVRKEFRIDDFLPVGSVMRIRFAASDLNEDSVVEAAVDDIQVRVAGCTVCYPDCNGDGAVNLSDFGCFTTKFALGQSYADCNGDFALNLADFGCFQTKFALGCP
ncbi:MAG: hypothetical protein IT437_09970 [Phycisphaerales bacterium]|nr:hypothetical protein [Phycisphaerales bacterium]